MSSKERVAAGPPLRLRITLLTDEELAQRLLQMSVAVQHDESTFLLREAAKRITDYHQLIEEYVPEEDVRPVGLRGDVP